MSEEKRTVDHLWLGADTDGVVKVFVDDACQRRVSLEEWADIQRFLGAEIGEVLRAVVHKVDWVEGT